MFLPFFNNLRDYKIPVSLREFLTFLEGMQLGLATYDVDHFYLLSRTILIKDERNLDKFDLAFSITFQGLDLSIAKIYLLKLNCLKNGYVN